MARALVPPTRRSTLGSLPKALPKTLFPARYQLTHLLRLALLRAPPFSFGREKFGIAADAAFWNNRARAFLLWRYLLGRQFTK
jgi:hypothetical protein